MPPKRSNAASKTVEDERDGGGSSAKRKSGIIPRKIVRSDVESGPSALSASTGSATATADSTATGAAIPSGAATATAAAASTTSTTAVSASSNRSRSAAASQPSRQAATAVSVAPAAAGLGLLPAKRNRVASMKARELAEQKRAGDLERSSDESDEPGGKGNGDNDDEYRSAGKTRRVSAGKRGRARRSATSTRARDDDFGDENAGVETSVAAGGKRVDKTNPRRSSGASSKQPVEASSAVARSAVSPSARRSKGKLLTREPSDPLPITVAVMTTSESTSNVALHPAVQSLSIGTVQILPAAAAVGSASSTPSTAQPLSVVPVDVAAVPAALPVGPSVEQQAPVTTLTVQSERSVESSVLASVRPAATAVLLDSVPLVVVEAGGSFHLPSTSGELASANASGNHVDRIGESSQSVKEGDGTSLPSTVENDAQQPSQPPVTVAALNDDGHFDQPSQTELTASKPPDSSSSGGAALSAASATLLTPTSVTNSSVTTAAHALSALSAIGNRSNEGIGEAAASGSNIRRAGGRKDGRSASAGSLTSPTKLADGSAAAAATAPGDRAQSSKPKTVECDICHKHVRRYDLNKHVKNVHSGDKPNKCPHCDYASPWKGNLNTHIAGVHLKARSHECTQCKLLFKTRGAMIGHVRKVHDRMYQPTERNFECEECHKKFFKKFHLQRHERVHTGEKPFLCIFCEKKFTSKTNMDTHIQSVHLKIKPYRCGFCEKGFGRKKLMVLHVRKYHIPNAPMPDLSDDDEADDDGDECDEELSDDQAEGTVNIARSVAACSSAATATASVTTAVPGSSMSATAATATASAAAATAAAATAAAAAAASQATPRVVYLTMPDVKETSVQGLKQFVVLRQAQSGAGDVTIDPRAVTAASASIDNAYTIAIDGSSAGQSASAAPAIVWQSAAAGDAEESVGGQQQTVRQLQQQHPSAGIVWQFEQVPAGSLLQAVQASDGTVILLATPAGSSLASAGGHQLAVVRSTESAPETIVAVETVAVGADSLLASGDRETGHEQVSTEGTA